MISAGTKTSYKAYSKNFDLEKEKGWINPSQRKFTLEEYAGQASKMTRAGIKNPSKAILEQQENFTAKAAIAQRKDLAKIKGFDKGPITFEYVSEFSYDKEKHVPVANATKQITIDFSNKSATQQRDLIRTLPPEAMVPLLMKLGFTRDEALEWIGY